MPEFESRHEPEEIRSCADAILTRYDDTPVRSFALTIATRQVRQCRRKETCDVSAGSS